MNEFFHHLAPADPTSASAIPTANPGTSSSSTNADGGGDSPAIIVVVSERMSTPIDLRDAGYQANAVEYRDFNLETVFHQRPALVILDLSLPIRASVEICSRIKSHGSGPRPRILLLLNRANDYLQLSGAHFRPEVYLVEPFTLSDLSCAIRPMVNPTGAAKELIQKEHLNSHVLPLPESVSAKNEDQAQS